MLSSYHKKPTRTEAAAVGGATPILFVKSGGEPGS